MAATVNLIVPTSGIAGKHSLLLSYAGTGAGLAIVRTIVERHGGQVWLESTPGDGIPFYVTIARG